MRRRWIHVFSICLMAVALLAGCSGNAQPDKQPDKDAAATQAVEEKREKLKVSMLIPSYSGGGWPDNKHPTIQYLNDKFDLELDIQWIPGPNYIEKLNVLAASGKLPDVYRSGSDIYEKWQNEGAFLDIAPYLDQYPNLVKAFPEELWSLKNPKSHIYGIPYGGPPNPASYIVRRDWLDHLGIPVPDPDTFTVDEFYRIAKAFALDDPDQDGKNNTLGFSFGGFGGEAPLRYAFGLSPGWQELDGKLIPYQVQSEEMKEYLTFLNKAYTEGVLDKDFPLNKGNELQEKISSGKLGLAHDIPIATVTNEKKLKTLDPDAEFVQLAPPIGPTGIQLNDTREFTEKILLNAEMNDEKRTRLLEMFDWWVTDEGTDIIKNGPPGVYYTDKGDGTYEATEAAISEGNRVAILNNWFFRRIAFDHDVFKWDSEAYKERIITQFENGSKYAAPYDPAVGLTHLSPTYAKTITEINKAYEQVVFKIIIGEKPVDEIEAAIDAWNKNGGQKIIQEVNDAYQAMKK
ncbi:hypothetical protein [Paenibacillus sp. PL2-23]|uniref:hypothetical protein n=1 Tax=Paenibacillus sp. PL2-23 TaxID=2100729 RepID=UPI0030F88D5E